jgi:hypothetical protein
LSTTAKTAADLIRGLRAPFTTAAIKWKIQTARPAGKALIVYYIDSRLVTERLNHVCPGAWEEETDIWPGPGFWRCRLTINGLGKHEDVGEAKDPKAGMSDAIKRVAVRFGVGVSVYAIPKLELSAKENDGFIRWYAPPNKDPQPYLQAKADDAARKHYASWLEAVGRHAFGEPIDHGDAEGAQGDVEVDDVGGDGHRAAAVPEPTPPSEPPKRSRRRVDPAPAQPANRMAKAHAVGAELGYDHGDLRTLAQWLTRNDHGDQSPVESMSDLDDDQLARLEASLEWMQQTPEDKAKLDALVARWVAKTAQASIAGTT